MHGEYAALVALLESLPGVPTVHEIVRVTDSGIPVRANYVVAFPPAIPSLSDDRYTAGQRFESKSGQRFDVRVVATTAVGVLGIAATILSHAIGAKLIVQGRRVDPLTLVPGVEEGKTEYDRQADLFYMDFTLETVSRPA